MLQHHLQLRRSADDEHPVFSQRCGRVLNRATEFDKGIKSGGYYDANGNLLLRLPRRDRVDHLERKDAHESKATVRSDRRRQFAARRVRSNVPLNGVGSDATTVPPPPPPIATTLPHRRLLSGGDVRTCLVHNSSASAKDDHRDHFGQRIRRIRRHNRVQRETDPSEQGATRDEIQRWRAKGQHRALNTNNTTILRAYVDDATLSTSITNFPRKLNPVKRPNAMNVSAGVSEILKSSRCENPTSHPSTQRRHYMSTSDYKNLSQSPARRDKSVRDLDSSLRRIRNVLPNGKAQAYRVLTKTFRKYEYVRLNRLSSVAHPFVSLNAG